MKDAKVIELEEVAIRFSGDSGDGMQLVGKKFSDSIAGAGLDLNTFPDFPSEIRAPEGTLYGVSAFQIRLGSKNIKTSGDEIDVLIAMNASSLKVNLPSLKKNGIIIANTSGFDGRNLRLAEYEVSPLDDDSLKGYKLMAIDMDTVIKAELKDTSISPKVMRKSKNFFALGMVYWLFDQDLHSTVS